MTKIGIIGAGHAMKYQYEALKKLGYEIILCDKDYEQIKKYKNKKFTNYKDLVGKVDAVLVSTPPKTHFEIINYFLQKNVFVISEKPLVCTKEELNNLKKLINNNFYNLFHFAYGDEINWFLQSEYKNMKPLKIVCHINDPYIEKKHIKNEAINLHGSYLDETINPLSAIMRIYGGEISYISSSLKRYEGDLYDYYAKSNFVINDIPIKVITSWNDNDNREKYIDIYFDKEIIRLDSFNMKALSLKQNKLLFKASGIRMLNHYLNNFKNFALNNHNDMFAIKINEEVLNYKK